MEAPSETSNSPDASANSVKAVPVHPLLQKLSRVAAPPRPLSLSGEDFKLVDVEAEQEEKKSQNANPNPKVENGQTKPRPTPPSREAKPSALTSSTGDSAGLSASGAKNQSGSGSGSGLGGAIRPGSKTTTSAKPSNPLSPRRAGTFQPPAGKAPYHKPLPTPKAKPKPSLPVKPTHLKRTVRFDEPDSPCNILFVQEAEEDESVSGTGGNGNASGDTYSGNATAGATTDSGLPVIRAATLEKLVERLTYEKYPDPKFVLNFLLTYRSFTTSDQLLSLLSQRYHMPPPANLGQKELEEYEATKLRPVRLRVFNVCKTWVSMHWYDFVDNEKLVNGVLAFAETMKTTGMKTASEQLVRKIQVSQQREREELQKGVERRASLATMVRPSRLKPSSSPLSSSSPANTPNANANAKNSQKSKPNPSLSISTNPPTSPPTSPTSPPLSTAGEPFSQFDPMQLAQQLTLAEFETYRKIKPWELLNLAWSKHPEQAPNVLLMITRFNQISNWCVSEIVTTQDLLERGAVLWRFIQLGECLYEIGNFNGCMEIVSALLSSSVYRLKPTWAIAGPSPGKGQKRFDTLQQLMSQEQNYSRLREHIRKCEPPLIPYLGIYLTDLTFIDEGNVNTITSEGVELVNFVKRRQCAQIIHEIQQYMLSSFDKFEPVAAIQEKLRNLRILDEESLYQASLAILPRGAAAEAMKNLPSKKQAKAHALGQKTESKEKEKDKSGDVLDDVDSGHEENANSGSGFEVALQFGPIDYPPGYPFTEPDSPKNILLASTSAVSTPLLFPQHPSFSSSFNSEGKAQIKAATVAKLVERLTFAPDPTFLAAFLATMHNFSTAPEILELLIQRFNVPNLAAGADPTTVQKYASTFQVPIRLRVFNVIKNWVEKYFDRDFSVSFFSFSNSNSSTTTTTTASVNATLEKLTQFIEKEMLGMATLSKAATRLLTMIADKKAGEKGQSSGSSVEWIREKRLNQSDAVPPCILPPGVIELHQSHKEKLKTALCDSSEHSVDLPGESVGSRRHRMSLDLAPVPKVPLLQWSPLEFARQISLYENELLAHIRPDEFQGKKSWDVSTDCPNVIKLTNFCGFFNNWISTAVVTERDAVQRTSKVHFFVQLGKTFLDMANYQGVLDVVNALNQPSVKSAQRGLASFSGNAKVSRDWDSIKGLPKEFARYRTFKRFLKKQALQGRPCVPPITCYLKEFARIEDSMHNVYDVGGVEFANWEKSQSVYARLAEVEVFQRNPFLFERVDILLKWVKEQAALPEFALLDIAKSEAGKEKEKDKEKDKEKEKSVGGFLPSNHSSASREKDGGEAQGLLDSLKANPRLLEELRELLCGELLEEIKELKKMIAK